MAWTEEYIAPSRWKQFLFFDTAAGAVASYLSATLNLSIPWKLTEIRIHFSVAMGSVKYLNIRLSSVKGSAYNTVLLSASLSGLLDYTVYYSEPLAFLSNDNIEIYTSVLSVANVYGIEVIGWSITG